MKLAKGTLKVIFPSTASIAENRSRVGANVGARMVPPWIVFEADLTGDEPAVKCHAAYGFKAARLTPKTSYRADRPYPWMPSVRPGFPGESILGTHVWLETTDEIDIQTEQE